MDKIYTFLVLLHLCSICQISFATTDELPDMDMEALLNIQVTSVSKKTQPLSEAPAAIFVISNEDIKRSGATSIPDALRLAPGMHVARIDANKWAISARGFNGRFANKLLVLIDGRSVYSPSFSGVYWEVQDVLLDDIDRIEVIRGPGATLWGANAVNGVINIITKHSADTLGGLLKVGGGDFEQGFTSLRYGAKLADGQYARAYFKAFQRNEFSNANDDWQSIRGGFRADTQLSKQDTLTIQGDIYKNEIDETLLLASATPPFNALSTDTLDTSGKNLLMHWQHTISSDSSFNFKIYYDNTKREEKLLFVENRDTFDIDFQHHFLLSQRHDIVYGFGYRYIRDQFEDTPVVSIRPRARDDELSSFFIQDEITLHPNKLWLTLGSKVEHNNYSGTEVQPNIRLLWLPHPRHQAWLSVSRAKRTPSRSEHDIALNVATIPPMTPNANPAPVPALFTVIGNHAFDSEQLTAYELGYRFQLKHNLSIDSTGFFHVYQDLRNSALGAPIFQDTHIVIPSILNNESDADIYGIELSSIWQATSSWDWYLTYSYWHTQFNQSQNTFDFLNANPKHQFSLRSSITFTKHWQADLWLRYTDDAEAISAQQFGSIPIDAYTTLDLRLAWQYQSLELAIVGQNLLDDRHLEYIQESFTLPTEIERSVYAQLIWSF